MEGLIIHNEILRHENSNLAETLIQEIRRRKRGKPMGLKQEDEPKYGQFWSPYKISTRKREIEAEKDRLEQVKLKVRTYIPW
jgi:hypothetical protein